MAGARTIGALWRNAAARASTRPPYLAEQDGGWVEITAGLAGGERVITGAVAGLSDGSAVRSVTP